MTDTDRRTEPALTPDEWERFSVWRRQHMIDATNSGPLNIRWNAGGGTPGRHYVELDDGERHALAALALYGQPFGFTWEDVDALRRQAAESRRNASHIDSAAYNDYGRRAQLEGAADWWDRFADRIAALLPPR